MSITINADGYTTLEAFIAHAGNDSKPGILRLVPTKRHNDSGTVNTNRHGNVIESRFRAADRRVLLSLPIDPDGQYTLEWEYAELGFAYLSGGSNLLERGIRIITPDTRATAHRPHAHFEPAQHWMNDPNALCRFRGRYHLFYQFNPYGWNWDDMHWGHAVSRDLVHWVDMPIALLPQPDISASSELTGGAFSGSAVTVNEQGRITYGDDAAFMRIYLTRHWARCGDPSSVVEVQTTATSADGLTFSSETTVIQRPDTDTGLDFRDPKIDCTLLDCTELAGTPAIVVATNLPSHLAPPAGAPGTVASAVPQMGHSARPIRPNLLSHSSDSLWYGSSAFSKRGEDLPDITRTPSLELFLATNPNLDAAHWEYAGPLLFETELPEAYTYECPDIFHLDGSAVAIGSLMHLHDDSGRFQPIRWYIGNIDMVSGKPKLVTQHTGWCDFGSCYYAAQSFLDGGSTMNHMQTTESKIAITDSDTTQRRIAIGWLSDWHGVRIERSDYANGTMGLPRELHVVDGRLSSRPVQEVYDLLVGEVLCEIQNGEQPLEMDITDNAYYANITPEAGSLFTMTLASGQRTQPDGSNATASLRLSSDGARVHLTTTGLPTDSFNYQSSTTVISHVEVFYDHGVAEVFVNDGEDVGSILFDCDNANNPSFCTKITISELRGLATIHKLRSAR